MARHDKVVVWFEEVGKEDIALAGGKGANLGEMVRVGIPVPPGFIVTAEAYASFVESSGLLPTISHLLSSLNPNDNESLNEVSSQIKEAIIRAPLSSGISQAIKRAYRKLGGGLVAVRSSATAEDLPTASFAGQQHTFLNISGEDAVVTAVQGCWASLFEARAIYYRYYHGFDHLKVKIAVPVQKMVQSEVSGVMFTAEPSGDLSVIFIDAVYGLGEAIVSGDVIPDRYTVVKEGLRLIEKKVSLQPWKLVLNPVSTDHETANIKVDVPLGDREKPKLSDEEILALARLGKAIEEHYQFPQDIEWAREGGKLYILQTRPITTLRKREEIEVVIKAPVILAGVPASPGLGSGEVQVILSAKALGKMRQGDVLVAEMTTPDFVPAMVKASAIVTDRGGRTCHAAIVSRELGIPCVVGTEKATKVLRPGQGITVDGSTGKVYEGRITVPRAEATLSRGGRLKTTTRIYVNLAVPDLAEKVAARNADGIGLLRAEFIIADYIGEHPRHMLEEERGHQFVSKLAQGLEVFAKAFNPRPVVYRTTDFKTNEYRNLKGGEKYEDIEENPMIGYRGVSRYVHEIDVFKMELEAIKKVREIYKNLWVMLPFVRTVQELAVCKRIMVEEGLQSGPDFKLWMMVEVPSNIFLLDSFIDKGIDGISIGSNDLTQLILGIDRDNPKLAEIFDERNEAVMMALESAIKTCRRRGVSASICGQAPSVFPDLTEKLVEWGITSVSVNPDMIERTREIVYDLEVKLGKAP